MVALTRSDQQPPRPGLLTMAANKVGRRLINKNHSPSRSRDSGQAIQRRQARVTVKYDRKELQKRLDVEKWIDESIEQLYQGRVREKGMI